MPRKQIKTQAYKTILLVVEGETEKIYFERLKAFERFSNVQIKPALPKHSDLGRLIDYAIKEAESGVYDSVWLLFDRDVISTQKIAKPILELINDEQKCQNVGINLADSLPCFEIWFLLHYCIPSQFYNNQNEVITDLCKHISNYSKKNNWLGKNNIYRMLQPKLSDALKNSQKLREFNERSGSSDCTMCNVDLLINQIHEFAKVNNP